MIRNARATIDTSALKHNYQLAKELAPDSRAMAVIKADAYGHGMLQAAEALSEADGFAVSHLNEAVALREAGVRLPITVFQGCQTSSELNRAVELNLRPVVHNRRQVEIFEQSGVSGLALWLKVNTGMGRMGVQMEEAGELWGRLERSGQAELGLMSHFANADVPELASNQQQIRHFNSLANVFSAPTSFANSSALIAFPESRGDWVRPGIMLYGASPLAHKSADELGLRPVMRFRSNVTALNQLKKGEGIGYGHTWHCPENMPVGVVSVGYGDGYPRHAGTGTPVWVNGQSTQLVGRVSMDVICIDIRDVECQVGDEVELWGTEVAVDDVARSADTIAYEILCSAGKCRVSPGG